MKEWFSAAGAVRELGGAAHSFRALAQGLQYQPVRWCMAGL